jgi:pyridine nucleotide-disulfide oxidoreductase family protein
MIRRVLLAGAGHAHAHVLKAWASAPVAGVELVVVSPYALAPYSGMVPSWLSGTYRFEDIVIDFPRLCEQAGARWIKAEVAGLDPQHQTLTLSNGECLQYDFLSLNVGSTLVPPSGAFRAQLLPMRPLADLHDRYEALLLQWRLDAGDQPLRVAAVGGGAAGFESLLAVLRRLRLERPDRVVHGALMTRSQTILPGYPPGAQRAALQCLREAGVDLQLETAWCDSIGDRSDWVLWATGAQPHAWQRDPMLVGGLAVSEQGFVQVDSHLQSVSHPNVFASGDCAQWVSPLPKAGVYAVRMGMVLAHNLQAALTDQPLKAYEPQSEFLSLLATADGKAIASRGRWSLSGRWAFWLKDYIDQEFIRRFSSLQLPSAQAQGNIR